jgi:hypothetical protein
MLPPPPIFDAFLLIRKRSLSSTVILTPISVEQLEKEPLDTQKRAQSMVGYWLLGCAGLVLMTVIIGGVTRLTESGLSIVEWKPVTGIMPPRSQQEWEQEFDKYKQFPEYKL